MSSATRTLPQIAIPVLAAISMSHLLNDIVQSLIAAVYPLLKAKYALDFAHLGLITLTFQITASLLQPVIGSYTDKHPKPYSLAAGMGCTLAGLLLLSVAPTFGLLLLSAALVGMGSAVFHPESSRVARLASGGRHGLAQSVFQVGGNAGSALGPLLAAFIVEPRGQGSIAWFSAAALLAMVLLLYVGRWYRKHLVERAKMRRAETAGMPRRQRAWALFVLIVLVFSKYFYLASITNFFIFYLVDKFHIPVQNAQIHLFAFLAAAAVGTIVGGPVGDRIGRKQVIWWSILGILPFTLILPWAGLWLTTVLSVVIGLVIASAFPAILVYAQELMPGRVGMVSGLFFGLAFGMGGVGAAVLGVLADHTSIDFVYRVCSLLPLLGLLTLLLPDIERQRAG